MSAHIVPTHSHSELSFDAIALHIFADTFALTLQSDCLFHIRNHPFTGASVLLIALVRDSWAVCGPYIRLEDNLDEPSKSGFCPDVIGSRNSIKFDRPMHVSCY